MNNFNDSGFKRKMDYLLNIKDTIMPIAYQDFISNTPKDSGNAKSNTQLRDNVIEAKYDYAEVLDKGLHNTNKGRRGSRQAPKGMSGPTVDNMIKNINDYIGRI